MYETFFGLKRRPFLAVPDTDSYFSVDAMEEARRTIQRTVSRGEGLSLVFGPSGTGKTLLLRLLRQVFETDFTVSLIANGHLESSKAFFQQILFDLHLPYSGADETELRLQLLEFARQATGLVLLVDESHFLDRAVLEEIRLLTDIDHESAPLFRAVLAGTTEFEEKLTHPHLEAFNQRVVSRSYLEPFSREDTYRYIQWQSILSQDKSTESAKTSDDDDIPDPASSLAEFIENSGIHKGHRFDSPHVKGNDPIFTMSARRQIHQLTGGVPRLINQLCDTALQLAAERVLRQVDEILVHSSWARLQQIDETEPTKVEEPSDSTMNDEDIDEIVARKKATFQPKIFDGTVQFGTLVDTPTIEDSASVEEIGTETTVEEVVEIEEAAEEPVPLRYGRREPVRRRRKITGFAQHTRKPPESDAPLRSVLMLASLSWTIRRAALTETWVGNVEFRPVFCPARWIDTRIVEQPVVETVVAEPTEPESVEAPDETPYETLCETPVAETVEPEADRPTDEERDLFDEPRYDGTNPTFEDPPMDQETLERYGAEILEGRPPFVRKEPNYAYQTTDYAPEAAPDVPEFPYPDPATGNVILLRWILPALQNESGFGTAYRDYLAREAAEEEISESESETVETVPQYAETPPILRPAGYRTALDEAFDEIVSVLREAVTPENLYGGRKTSSFGTMPVDAGAAVWNEPGFQRQVETVLKQITEAAEKIEQAAEVSLAAGHQVRRAADFVETEVQAALPTYIDLFQELSEFQKTISEELAFHREMSRISGRNDAAVGDSVKPDNPLRCLPFPRRPDFAPNRNNPEAASSETPPNSTPGEETPKDDQSIDVRTLFQ